MNSFFWSVWHRTTKCSRLRGRLIPLCRNQILNRGGNFLSVCRNLTRLTTNELSWTALQGAQDRPRICSRTKPWTDAFSLVRRNDTQSQENQIQASQVARLISSICLLSSDSCVMAPPSEALNSHWASSQQMYAISRGIPPSWGMKRLKWLYFVVKSVRNQSESSVTSPPFWESIMIRKCRQMTC